jgi:maltose alpha-D-glucosyltransferase / alpha-amylase
VPGDGAWRALAVAMADGRAIAALPRSADTGPTAALVCRPGPAMPPDGPGPERDLGADQSNTTVVLGDPGTADQILLKAYRRIQPGLNPDLEMTAFLTEEAGFTAVPPLAGFVELVEARHGTSTLAMGQAFVLDGADGYEAVAEALTAWLLAPGAVTLEFATEVAADVGALTAGLHAAVADGRGLAEMGPRPATRDELRSWSREAHARLDRALDVAAVDVEAATTIRELAPRIQEVLTVIDALP